MFTAPATPPAPGVSDLAGGPAAIRWQEVSAMQVRIHTHGVHANDELRTAIERRLDLSIGRFGTRVKEVRVWLSDDNGPRGGVDKAVRMELELTGTKELRVEQVSTSWQSAVDMAAGRLGRTAAREIERRRSHRTHAEIAEVEPSVDEEPSVEEEPSVAED
jgi:ribosome-associated translation inhibitor RaiA